MTEIREEAVYWYFSNSSASTALRNKGGTVGDLHLKGMREEMAELAEELRLAEYRFNAAETGAQERTIDNEIEALELEVDKLKLKEAEYLSDH